MVIYVQKFRVRNFSVDPGVQKTEMQLSRRRDWRTAQTCGYLP